jgi:hypothetical protein
MGFAAGRYRFVLVLIMCELLASCATTSHSSAVTSAAEPFSVVPTTSGSASPASPSPAPASPSASPSSPSATKSPSIPAGYDQYTNARYGFTTLWPSSLQIQAQPADNDGQKWASPDGQVQMLAFGSNNIQNYSPRQDEAAAVQGMSVTYANVSGDVVTVSGYMNNRQAIIYRRDVVGPGAIDTLYWSYPASQKAKWDAAVTLTALSFRPGNLDTTH